MALNKETLKSSIQSGLEQTVKSALTTAFGNNKRDGVTEAQAIQNITTELSAALAATISASVDTYVRAAVVTVTAAPSTINVAGSATAQTNPEPVQINGTLS